MNTQLADLYFKKASSSQANGSCVEVAAGTDVVAVRDTKAREFAILAVDRDEWTAFIADVPSK